MGSSLSARLAYGITFEEGAFDSDDDAEFEWDEDDAASVGIELDFAGVMSQWNIPAMVIVGSGFSAQAVTNVAEAEWEDWMRADTEEWDKTLLAHAQKLGLDLEGEKPHWVVLISYG